MRKTRYLISALILVAVLVLIQPLITAGSQRSATPLDRPPGTSTARGIIAPPATVAPLATSLYNKGLTAWLSSPLSGPVKNPPIPHFGVIDDGIIYRSAQPTEADLRWLHDQGFKSIVSFQGETGDDSAYHAEQGFGDYLWLDIPDEKAPTDAQAQQFLDFVTDSRHWPVLIHCKLGLGRTGIMAALVRYAIDGWSLNDALKEARLYRGGVDLVQPQVDWLKHWVATHPPGSARLPSSTPTAAR